MKHSGRVLFVGQDVQKDSLAAAYALQRTGSEVVTAGSTVRGNVTSTDC